MLLLLFSSLQNYVLRGVKLCISFVTFWWKGWKEKSSVPSTRYALWINELATRWKEWNGKSPIILVLYNIGTQKHGVTESWTENYIYSLCLCVSVFIKLQSKQILVGLEKLAVLFITTRRFPMKKTAVYEMELDGLSIVHQRFDNAASMLWWQFINWTIC